jgi:hypothetical protein
VTVGLFSTHQALDRHFSTNVGEFRRNLQAGKHKLILDEIIRLHNVLIEDTRFVRAGLRPDAVFLGERDHLGDPLPEFIGARPEDLADLMAGMLEANDRMRDDGLDPVLQAAATAFGFVYVHPFQDGNGRLHRCLIHHVLAERHFTPTGMVFPVSSVMLDRIADYRTTLQAHSAPLMPYIEWRPTSERNVEVLNDTADLYRYFDLYPRRRVPLRLRPPHGRRRLAARDRLSAPARPGNAAHDGGGRNAGPDCGEPRDVHPTGQRRALEEPA